MTAIKEDVRCVARCTARRYDLERLALLLSNSKYGYSMIHSDYIYAQLQPAAADSSKYLQLPISADTSGGEVFFFRDGITVTWNTTDQDRQNLMSLLKTVEIDSFSRELQDEEETLGVHDTSLDHTRMDGDTILLATSDPSETILNKLALSHGLARSTQLGVLENHLVQYLNSIQHIPTYIRRGKRPPISQKEVMMKHGQLLYIRGLLNLHSDLVDTPEFYWSRADLNKVFLSISRSLDVDLRIRILNQRLDHANQLLDLMRDHLGRQHGTRMEWIIIALIAVEVGFEIIHYLDKLEYIDLSAFSYNHISGHDNQSGKTVDSLEKQFVHE